MDSLTYKQLLDFTIGVLYELRVKQKRTGYYSLNEIIKYFNYEVSFDEIRDIAKYLEAQGYVKTVFIYGDVFLELTTRGIIYFEAKDKAFFTSFDAFRKARQKEKIKDTVEQLDKKIMASSKENLVKEIQDFKKDIKKLNDKNQYTDYLSDIDILIIELQKDNPDKEILAHKTNKLLENLNFRDKLSKIVSKLNIE